MQQPMNGLYPFLHFSGRKWIFWSLCQDICLTYLSSVAGHAFHTEFFVNISITIQYIKRFGNLFGAWRVRGDFWLSFLDKMTDCTSIDSTNPAVFNIGYNTSIHQVRWKQILFWLVTCVFVCTCAFVTEYTYLSVCLCVCLSACLPVCLSVLSVCLFVYRVRLPDYHFMRAYYGTVQQ